MKIIKLTTGSPKKYAIYINMDSILYFRPLEEGVEGTQIVFSASKGKNVVKLAVYENPDKVLSLLATD